MPRTPRLTPRRAAHLFYAQWDRNHTGTTRVTYINNGGRSRLQVVVNYDGATKPGLSPGFHKSIGRDTDDAAHAYARAVYGPRRAWPVHIVIERPTEPLNTDDAARHMGDHVLNNRVYTFNQHADAAARRLIDARKAMAGQHELLKVLHRPSYERAQRELAFCLGLGDSTSRFLFQLARSYVRANPEPAA